MVLALEIAVARKKPRAAEPEAQYCAAWEPEAPASRFPLPASRFPLPASRFPLPASRFPLPASDFRICGTPHRHSPIAFSQKPPKFRSMALGATIENIWHDARKSRIVVGLLVAVLAFGLNTTIHGTINLDWQHLYRPEDFHSWGDLWAFLGGLQTGISPIWAFLEVSVYLIFGSTAFFSYVLYPLTIGLNAYWSTTLFARTRWQVLLSGGVSLVCAVAIRYMHKGNPQLYDMLMPCLILAWLAVLQQLRAPDARPLLGLSLAAGTLISLLELTRTLIFPLLPILLLLSFLAFRPLPVKYFLVFLLPILLFSGGWHLKQVVSHGQVHWSNHDGFNMQKSWSEFSGPVSDTFQDAPPLYVGGFDNINTDRHTAYNKVVKQQVQQAILRQPLRAVGHVATRLVAFYRPKTVLFMAQNPGWLNLLYRPAVWLGGLSVLVGLLWLGWQTLRAPLRRATWAAWSRPEAILGVVTLLISCVFAAGEVGEEARFMISILPLLTAAIGAVFQLRSPADARAV
jgi:hypothetical protein